MDIYYDEEGDFLEITSGDISNCYFDNIDDGIFKIIDKNTKEVKGIKLKSGSKVQVSAVKEDGKEFIIIEKFPLVE